MLNMSTTVSLYGQLLTLIQISTSLSDNDKKRYCEAVENNTLTPIMQNELYDAFIKEEAELNSEISQVDQALVYQEQLVQEEEKNIEEEGEIIEHEHQKELSEIELSTIHNFNQIERNLNNGIEGHMREKDTTEADAIRAMLQEPPKTAEY